MSGAGRSIISIAVSSGVTPAAAIPSAMPVSWISRMPVIRGRCGYGAEPKFADGGLTGGGAEAADGHDQEELRPERRPRCRSGSRRCQSRPARSSSRSRVTRSDALPSPLGEAQRCGATHEPISPGPTAVATTRTNAGEDPVAADSGRDLLGGLDSVLHGEHSGVRPDHRGQCVDRRRQL